MLIPTTKIKGIYIKGCPLEVEISFMHCKTPISLTKKTIKFSLN